MALMQISELAQRSGVAASTLRYYEERGLLPAQRSPAGYRLYDQRALERLAFITTAKKLGLDLEEIGELTAIWAERPCAQVRATLRPRLLDRLAEADKQSAILKEFRELLRAALTRFDELPDRDTPCDPGCAFLSVTEGTSPARVRQRPRATSAASCSLRARDAQQRISDWRSLLENANQHSTPEGCTWSLPLADAGALAELAAAERQCCSFLILRIDFTAQRVRLHARVDGQHSPDPDSSAWQIAYLLGVVSIDTREARN